MRLRIEGYRGKLLNPQYRYGEIIFAESKKHISEGCYHYLDAPEWLKIIIQNERDRATADAVMGCQKQIRNALGIIE